MRIEIIGVGKRYRGDAWALKEVSLTLQPGVIGLLGPNGAGKSTLMNILATITQPSTGKVLLDGVDCTRKPDVMRRQLGYLPQDFGVYPNLSARAAVLIRTAFLRHWATLKISWKLLDSSAAKAYR